MRYYVIEMWENTEPNFVTRMPELENDNDIPEIFSTNSLNEAIEEAKNSQEGYILDMEEMKIINI